jgi:hypothetical protein
MTVGGSRPGREFSSLLLAALVVIPWLSGSAPVYASDDCLLDYANCVDVASDLSSFGRRSAAGLRCYLDLLSCLQRRLA